MEDKMREIKIGKTYRHFKGKICKVIDIVNDSESTDKELKKNVIYEETDNHTKWARPYDMFASPVDKEKYPNIKQEYRFEEIE